MFSLFSLFHRWEFSRCFFMFDQVDTHTHIHTYRQGRNRVLKCSFAWFFFHDESFHSMSKISIWLTLIMPLYFTKSPFLFQCMCFFPSSSKKGQGTMSRVITFTSYYTERNAMPGWPRTSNKCINNSEYPIDTLL